METTATKCGNEWILNGEKTFITNATEASFIVVLAQTDTKIRPTHRGETLFVVENETSGLETRKLHDKMGIRCSFCLSHGFSLHVAASRIYNPSRI